MIIKFNLHLICNNEDVYDGDRTAIFHMKVDA